MMMLLVRVHVSIWLARRHDHHLVSIRAHHGGVCIICYGRMMVIIERVCRNNCTTAIQFRSRAGRAANS